MWKYPLYCLLIILPIYQDSPLALVAGAYGFSLAPTVSLLLVIPVLLACREREYGVFAKGWCCLVVYLVAVNLIAITIWSLAGCSIVARGESVYVKTIKGLLFPVSVLAYLVDCNLLSRSLSEKRVCQPFTAAFYLIGVIALVEMVQIPNAFQMLHASGDFPYWRPRLLSTESSWTSMLVVVYGIVSFHYYLNVNKSTLKLLICFVILCFAVGTSGSKALLAIVGILVVFVLFSRTKNDIRYILVVPPIVMLVLLSGLASWFFAMVNDDLKNYTSIATRLYTNLVAIKYILTYPLGTGTALYVQLYPDMLVDNLPLLDVLPGTVNTSEIMRYAVDASSDFGLSAKSGFFQYAMYWGVPGIVLLIGMQLRAMRELRRSEHLSLINVGLLVCCIALFAFMTFDYEYEIFALWALCDWYVLHLCGKSRIMEKRIRYPGDCGGLNGN